MRPVSEGTPSYLEARALVLLVTLITLTLAWILAPFSWTIMWGAIVALMAGPVHRRLLHRLRGSPTVAALATVLVVLVVVILPAGLITASLVRESVAVYARVQSGEWAPMRYLHEVFAALPAWMRSLLARLDLADFDALQSRLSAELAQRGAALTTRALSVGQDTVDLVVHLFLTLYLAFFFIRDGQRLMRGIERAIPLSTTDKQVLIGTFATVIRATVKGHLLVAATQGLLGGLAFWYLGITGALLWAVLMAFLSLLPMIGAALVWAPVAIWLYSTGAVWQSLGLVVFGVLVIGLVDNVMRPMLVGKDTRMPDYVVLLATLGGVIAFGFSGVVAGPAIAAMFIAIWHLHTSAREAGK